MLGFNRRSLKRIKVTIELKLIIGSDLVSCTTSDVTKKGLCINVPIKKIKNGMIDKLEERVSLYLGDAIFFGLIRWYNVENSSYSVGIKLDRNSRGKWWDLVGPIVEAHLAEN